jgi:hypothetical protein
MTTKWSDRAAQELVGFCRESGFREQPRASALGKLRSETALKASPTPRSRGANRGGRASSRAARMCHNPKVCIRPRSQHGLVFGSNPAAAGRGRDLSRAMDGTQSKNEAPCEWRPRLAFWCSVLNSRTIPQGRVPLSGHLFLAANPGLKPWAIISNHFMVQHCSHAPTPKN